VPSFEGFLFLYFAGGFVMGLENLNNSPIFIPLCIKTARGKTEYILLKRRQFRQAEEKKESKKIKNKEEKQDEKSF